MLNPQESRTLVAQGVDDVDQLVDFEVVQAAGDLVEKDDFRIEGYGTSQLQSFAIE